MKVYLPVPSIMAVVGDEDLREWRESLRRPVEGAKYTKAYKRGSWDGYKRPGRLTTEDYGYKWVAGRGLLHRFMEDHPGTEIERDFELMPEPDWDEAREKYRWDDFRDYQRQTIRDIWSEQWGRVGIATGGGKGLIIGVTAAMARDVGLKTLILADEISVFEALREEIETWGHVEPALVEAGREQPPANAPITLGMVPTLSNRVERQEWEDWLETIDIGFLDEADRATADSWQDVTYKMTHNHIRVGFSGSFDTSDPVDQMQQEEMMGPMLVEIKNEELIERDISAKPHVELHRFPHQFHTTPDPSVWYDWSGPKCRRWTYENYVINNDKRNDLVADLLHPTKQNAIVVERIEHGEVLEERLPNSFFMHGDHSKSERDEILKKFKNLEIQNLIATKLINRGTNRVRDARRMIIASGEGSRTAQLQKLGRVLRKAEGKEQVVIKDIIDVPTYDPPDVNPGKYFKRASRKRVRVYHDENFTTEVVEE